MVSAITPQPPRRITSKKALDRAAARASPPTPKTVPAPRATAPRNTTPKKTLEKLDDKKYSKSVDSPVCHRKEDKKEMANQEIIKGSGSIAVDRGIWVVRARVLDPETGKYKQRSKSTGLQEKGNKRKAQKAMSGILDEWEREVNERMEAVTFPTQSAPLFSVYVQKYIDRKRMEIKATTVQSYQDYADLHIIPALGHWKVTEITYQIVQDYYNEKHKTLSVTSLKKHHSIIKGALLDAVRDGIIQVNYADYVKFPRKEKFMGKSYTTEQVSALLQAVEQEGEPIRAAIILAACYGLRRSETCGLRWSDIDFDGKTLSIQNTRTRYRNIELDEEQTKTRKSRRTFELLQSTVPYLKELKREQEKRGYPLDKVCVWLDSGEPVRPEYISQKTKKIMQKYGLERIRLHDLRHTVATLLLRTATVKQVQDFMGHEDASTTMNIYAHVLDEDKRKTSAIMDDILQNSVFCSGSCSETVSAQS